MKREHPSVASSRIQHLGAGSIRDFAELAESHDDVVDLSVGQPDFDVPSPVKLAAISSIVNGRNRYTATGGTLEIRQRFAEHISHQFPLFQYFAPDGQHGFSTLLTSGVTGGIIDAFVALIDADTEVLIAEPYFCLYPEAVRMCGGRPVLIDTFPDFQLTAARIEEFLTPQTKLLVLNSPANPTGSVIPREELKRILQLAADHGIIILSDEIYADFTCSTPHEYTSVADLSSEHLVFRGFSKSHSMTGWRIGYVFGPARLIRLLELVQGQAYVCPPTHAQAGAVAALALPPFEQTKEYQHRRELVTSAFRDHFEFSTCEGGFYFFARVPDQFQMEDADFTRYAITQGVLFVPGKLFSRRSNYFRLSITAPRDRLVVGVERLVQMVRAR